MIIKYRLYFIGAGLIVLGLWLRSCVKSPKPVITAPLPDTDVLRVGVKDRVITVQTDSGEDTQYVPDSGNVLVSVDKQGDVTINVKNKGLSFVPVFGINVNEKLDAAIGLQLAYWNRFELYGGVLAPHLAGFVAGGYRLDQLKLRNTSVYVSYSTTKDVGMGVLLRF